MIPQRTGLWPDGNGSGKDGRKAHTTHEVPHSRRLPGEEPYPAHDLPKHYRLALLAGLRQVRRPEAHPDNAGGDLVLPTESMMARPRRARPVHRPPLRRILLWALAVLLCGVAAAVISAGWLWLDGLQRELLETRTALSGANARLTAMERHGQTADRERMQTLRREWQGRLTAEVERLEARDAAMRNDLTARIGADNGSRTDFPAAYAHARNAMLFIRTDYRVKLLITGEERGLTAFGTGFFITPGGMALTAQHVLFPWRYDRTLQASIEAGVVERIENSTRISVWPTGTHVTRGDRGSESEEADFVFENAYRSGGGLAQVEVLGQGEIEMESELVNTPVGTVEISLPDLGRGDWAMFQVWHPGKRFEHLDLARETGNVAALDEVMVVGYPLSRLLQGKAEPQPSRGHVRVAGEDMLELDTPLHPGNSGGPVLDGQGRVVGMASAVLDSPVYGIAVPATELRRAWESMREEIRSEQSFLKALGCEPGPLDGIPGPATRAARRCAMTIGSS